MQYDVSKVYPMRTYIGTSITWPSNKLINRGCYKLYYLHQSILKSINIRYDNRSKYFHWKLFIIILFTFDYKIFNLISDLRIDIQYIFLCAYYNISNTTIVKLILAVPFSAFHSRKSIGAPQNISSLQYSTSSARNQALYLKQNKKKSYSDTYTILHYIIIIIVCVCRVHPFRIVSHHVTFHSSHTSWSLSQYYIALDRSTQSVQLADESQRYTIYDDITISFIPQNMYYII